MSSHLSEKFWENYIVSIRLEVRESDDVSDTDLNVYHLQESGLVGALALTGPDMN